MKKPTDYLFVAPVVNLDLAPIHEGYQIMPGLALTKDCKGVLDEFPKEFLTAIGPFETQGLLNATLLAFAKVPRADMKHQLDGNQFITVIYHWLFPWLRTLWLSYDNAANAEYSYACFINTRGNVELTSNYPTLLLKNASFETTPVVLSDKDVASVCTRHMKLQGYLCDKKEQDHNQLSAKSISRIGRAFHFIRAARSASNIAFRISLMCSCLECLFSTEVNEIAHKLAERVALFVEEDPAKRKTVFSIVKRSYNVRSTFLHGGALTEKKLAELKALSLSIDGVVRVALCRIIDSPEYLAAFDGSTGALDTIFINLLFPEGAC